MTQQEYEQKRAECWETFLRLGGGEEEIGKKLAFDFAFYRGYALGKQEKDTDTVIQGWVCRDKKDNALNLHAEEPYRTYSHYNTDDKSDWWESDCASFLPLDNSLFPNLTWDDEPIEVEIIIKRKRNENNNTASLLQV